jgi:bacterioferritin-associated ferredoxin
MIVCVCFAISDRLVRERARAGVSLAAVLEETGAGSACGTCRLAVARIHSGEHAEPARCGGACAARAVAEAA